MKLKKTLKVKFDELTHTYYTKDMKYLIGVTSLMKKHGLAPDYSGIAPEVLARAAKKGTALHKLLQDYDDGKQVVETPELAEYRKLGLDVICSEYLVTDGKMVASMIDKVLYVDENTVDLADVKRTSTLHKNAVAWQLSIYKHLIELMNPKIKVRNLYAIHFRNEKCSKVEIQPVPVENVKRLLACEKAGILYDGDGMFQKSASDVLSDNETSEFISTSLRIAELETTIKALKATRDEVSGRLIDYMVKNNLTKLDVGDCSITLKGEYQTQRLDSAALKKAYPQIADQFTKTSTVKASLIFNNK